MSNVTQHAMTQITGDDTTRHDTPHAGHAQMLSYTQRRTQTGHQCSTYSYYGMHIVIMVYIAAGIYGRNNDSAGCHSGTFCGMSYAISAGLRAPVDSDIRTIVIEVLWHAERCRQAHGVKLAQSLH